MYIFFLLLITELKFEPLESTLSFGCTHASQQEDEVSEVVFYTIVTNEDYPGNYNIQKKINPQIMMAMALEKADAEDGTICHQYHWVSEG